MSDEFPVDSFREAARHLRRPFEPAAVKFKVQATWPKEKPTHGLIVAYIDARLVVERLNLVVPHLWHDEYEPLGREHLICRLTVDGITRQDIGEGAGKGLYSDALKRAAVKFGIGVSLYAIPQTRLDVSSGALREARTRDGLTLALTGKADKLLRDAYRVWLDKHGVAGFGDPLNHGDVEGAVGDHEAVPANVDPATGELLDETPNGPSAAQLSRIRQEIDKQNISGDEIRRLLDSIGAKDAKSAKELTGRQASSLITLLADPIPTGESDIPSDIEPPPAVDEDVWRKAFEEAANR